MKKELEEMFLSNNEEDVRLALEIAKRTKVPVKEVDAIYERILYDMDSVTDPEELFEEYLDISHNYGHKYDRHNASNNWRFYRWKRRET